MSEFKSALEKLEQYIKIAEEKASQLPHLKRMYELGKIEDKILDSFPSNSPFIVDLNNSMIEGFNLFSNSIGEIPITPNIRNAFVVTISGATGSYQSITNYDAQSQLEKNWKNESLSLFRTAFDNENAVDKIRDFFSNINATKNLIEFEEFLHVKSQFESNLVDHTALGNKMRNVILHFKGILKKAAQINRGTKVSNKQLSWPKMSEGLIDKKVSTTIKNKFVALGTQWTVMHSQLSEILKDYSISNKDDLINLCVQIVALIEAFIEIVDIEKVKKGL